MTPLSLMKKITIIKYLLNTLEIVAWLLAAYYIGQYSTLLGMIILFYLGICLMF